MSRIAEILLIFCTTIGLSLHGQLESVNLETDTSDYHKNYAVPAYEIVGINTIINRVDYWLLNAEWAKVSWDTWKENIRVGFESDGDSFGTNFFGHPYHGSLFFNSARSNGLTFWESIPYTAAGSLLWEYFGENQPPSEIDMGTTVYGGIYLGEMTHRIATHLLSNHRNKKNKFIRTSISTIINPISQLNGLMNKSINEKFRNNKDVQPLIRSQLSIGANFPFGKINDKDASTRIHLNYSMLYGDLFVEEKKYKPFDFFVLRSWADISLTDQEHVIFFNLTSHAPLWKRNLNEHSAISISNHYDFLNNEVFKIGAMSITGDYSIKIENEHSNILGAAKLGMILFGSSSSEVVQYLQENGTGITGFDEFLRDYVYGHGITFELECLILLNKHGHITLNYNDWFLYTKRDAKGTEHNSVLDVTYYYPLFKKLSLGLQAYYYNRIAKYPDLPPFTNVHNRYVDLKILLSVTF